MKLTYLLLFTISLLPIHAETDQVASRPIVRFKDDVSHIVTTESKGGPQLEITVGDGTYGIAQLAKGGVPPFAILKTEKGMETVFTTIKDGKEIAVLDSNGDGLPEIRLTIVRDEKGKTVKVIKEIITFTFTEKK